MNQWARPLAIIHGVFVFGSMCLTGYFGWTLGEGIWVLGAVLAMLGAAISYTAPLFSQMATYYGVRGLAGRARIFGAFALLLFFADVMSNFGLSATVRQMNVVEADNTNAVAQNARDEVARLKKQIADAQATNAWSRTDLAAPSVYAAKIAQLKTRIDARGRNIYRRSGQCGDVTVVESERLCEAIRSAQAEMAMAEQRQLEARNISAWGQELALAKGRVADTPTVASSAVSQIKTMAQLFTFQLAPGEASQAWTGIGVMVIFSMVVSLAAVLLGMACGYMAGDLGTHDDFPPPRERLRDRMQRERNLWREELTDRRSDYDREVQDGPARSYTRTPDGGTTVLMASGRTERPGVHVSSTDTLGRQLDRLEEIAGRLKNSTVH